MSTAGPESFDDYVKRNSIQPGEYGAAFAAYLHDTSGGEWDGRAERVESAGERNGPFRDGADYPKTGPGGGPVTAKG